MEKIEQEITTTGGRKITFRIDEEGNVRVDGARSLSVGFIFTDDFVELKDEELCVWIQKELGAVPGVKVSVHRGSKSPDFAICCPPTMEARFRKALDLGKKDIFAVQAFKGNEMEREVIDLGSLPIWKEAKTAVKI